MHFPKPKSKGSIVFSKNLYNDLANYIKSIQLQSGAIPSNSDGSHDPWDHIESIMGLNFLSKSDSSKSAFKWLIKNQNADGSWYSKYIGNKPIEINKPTHFSPYISVAALHYHKIYCDIEFLKTLWPSIKAAINFSINIQNDNGTIPWSIDANQKIENDYLLTGSSSILKSIECGIALSNILKDRSQLKDWNLSYQLLSKAIKSPKGKFDLLKDRQRFSMDSYYPILSGCLNEDEKKVYIEKVMKKFYVKNIGIKCVEDEPWVTVAETCEFIISLMASNSKELALKLLSDVINISNKKGEPYMGWQYVESIFWPNEKPSWTAAALMISADSVLNHTSAFDLFLSDQSILY